MPWVQPKFSSLDQMSLTFTGWIPGGRGAGLEGLKNSLRRSLKPPKLPPQSTSRRLLTTFFETLGAERKNLRFSAIPEPKAFLVKGTSERSTILTGRSKRNCLRFDQKSSGMRWAGVPKSGIAESDTGTICSGPERLGFLNSSGRRLISPATCFPRVLDAYDPSKVRPTVGFRQTGKRLRALHG